MQTMCYSLNYDIPVSCPNTDHLSSLLLSSEQPGILRRYGVSLVSASRSLKSITVPSSSMVGHFLDRFILDDDGMETSNARPMICHTPKRPASSAIPH